MTTNTPTPSFLNPDAEQVARSIEALGHSVDLINKVIESEDKSDESIKTITNNYKHLEIMLAKDFILKSGSDLSESKDAIAAAKAYLS